MSSGFISESELSEQRRLRQEEWERVRTSDQPLERPEEKYDPRSLYEKLQEQKTKRDLEYEEAHKLKNMIKGLDDDEVEFLDLVDRTKLEEERKKNLEEAKEMRDFKAAVASLQEKSLDERLKLELKSPQSTNKSNSSGNGRNSQVRLLAGVVVKKSDKTEKSPKESPPSESKGVKRKLSETQSDEKPSTENKTEEDEKERKHPTVGMKCIGILPGLGPYNDSSDSDCSSDSEHDECDNRVNTNSRYNPQKTSAEN
ncbi:PSME3-interacting protein isoform X2 [Chelonus insularis]|uniref:PSME3-interacting protein isoform X2 n=1 Tax=Chelonus insularis TaxID=460826 RepID=UPI001588A373|nr:PSME3-interacting protein isoform X2 [Chelonus insularis]